MLLWTKWRARRAIKPFLDEHRADSERVNLGTESGFAGGKKPASESFGASS